MRYRNRSTAHRTTYYFTRMVAGSTRPRAPDEIAIICRAYKRILEIDRSLKPFMLEQQRLAEGRLRAQECEAALAKVYGLPKTD